MEKLDMDNIEGIIDKAEQLLKQEKFKDTINLYLGILQKYETYVDIWFVYFRLGDCYYMLQDYDRAEFYLLQAKNLMNHEEHQEFYFDLLELVALTYLYSNKYDLAIDYFKKAEKYLFHYPDHLSQYHFRHYKGRCYYFLEQYKRSIIEYKLALKELIQEDDSEQIKVNKNILYISFASAYMYLVKPNKANLYLNKVDLNIKLEKYYLGNFFYLRGLYNYHKYDYEHSIDDFRNSLKYGGFEYNGEAEIYFYIGSSYNRLGQYDLCYENFKKASTFQTGNSYIKNKIDKFLKKYNE